MSNEWREAIVQGAQNSGVSVKEYLAMSPGLDPFYVGSEGQMQKALWAKGVYEDIMDSPWEVHLRMIHYKLVSLPDAVTFKGLPYENTIKCWKDLTQSFLFARYLGYVPMDSFRDRRNPPPYKTALYWGHRDVGEQVRDFESEEAIESIVNNFLPWNPTLALPYHLELWIEKSTMDRFIRPIIDKYKGVEVAGLGELSLTSVNPMLLSRIRDSGNKPTRIVYVSDFDPAGANMPVSVSRKIEYYARQDSDLDVRVKHIMLTRSQCQEFELPRTPVKDTDIRKAGWEEKFGEGATELDALEALHPGELSRIIEAEFKPYFDTKEYWEINAMNRKLRKAIREYIEPQIGNVLEGFDLSDFEDYEPEHGEPMDEDDEPGGWLYDSRREYGPQLVNYKRYRQTGSVDE